MSKFVLLKGHVQEANPVASHYTFGLPSLTAIQGFITSLLIDTKIDEKDLEEFYVGFNNVEIGKGNLSVSNYRNDSISGKNKPSAIPELMKHMSFNFDIILSLKDDCSFYTQDLASKLACKSFCGGAIFYSKVISESELLNDEDPFLSILKKVDHNTYFLKDETFLLLEKFDYNEDDIEEKSNKYLDNNDLKEDNSIIEKHNGEKEQELYFLNEENAFKRLMYLIRKEINHSEKIVRDYYTPVTIGYRLLEDPTNSRSKYVRGVIKDDEINIYDHAFAEPILGVVKLVRKHKLIGLVEKNNMILQDFAFSQSFNKDTKQFLVKVK